jgi:signal transduction histidine kinase
MAPGEIGEAGVWLTELPPSPRQNWLSVAVVAVALVAFGAVVPFSGKPLAQLNAFFPSLDAIVFVSDLITSVLLFAQFSISRSRSLLALANGYLFSALIVVPHALTFSGAFSPTGLLGAGIQTGSWLFVFWHVGFAAGLLAYSVLREDKSTKSILQVSTIAATGWSVAGVLGLVSGLTWLATAGVTLMPPIILDNARIGSWVAYPIWFAILISAAALVVLSFGRRSLLDQWLMVVTLVFILELAFSGLIPSVRFSVGFYFGRVFSLVTSSIVLIVMLAETTRLYAGMTLSNAALQREKNSRILNFEALVASIIHETSQPLGAIELNGSTVEMLLEETAPNFEVISTIVSEMSRAGRRINETLESIRSLFGGVDQSRAAVNLNEIALEALRSSHIGLTNHNVTVRTKFASELPIVYGAKTQLYQVIYNLLQNAIEAMSSTEDRRILEVRTEHRASTIVVEVVDTGPGIESTQMENIFNAFVTTKPHGMGLGLAICRMIVERHEGQLSASSADPRGAIFRIILPQTNSPH